MNKLAMALAAAWLVPVVAISQDDLYFVPEEEHEERVAEVRELPVEAYYSGSQRDVDEYNRRGSYVQQIDSAGNDIIDFDGAVGVYPDTLADYECTRQMSRFDDYSWFDPYWAGYNDGRWDSWWWNDPWYYSYWYDPWFYAGWGYYPWHYHAWYPYHHHWYVGSYYRPYRGITGTANHGFVNRGGRWNGGTGYRGSTAGRRGTSGGSRKYIRNFSGNRSSNRVSSSTSTRRPSYSSGNSFGGSRSGGGFSGSRSGGGSRVGGGSRGGGGGFRGRR